MLTKAIIIGLLASGSAIDIDDSKRTSAPLVKMNERADVGVGGGITSGKWDAQELKDGIRKLRFTYDHYSEDQLETNLNFGKFLAANERKPELNTRMEEKYRLVLSKDRIEHMERDIKEKLGLYIDMSEKTIAQKLAQDELFDSYGEEIKKFKSAHKVGYIEYDYKNLKREREEGRKND